MPAADAGPFYQSLGHVCFPIPVKIDIAGGPAYEPAAFGQGPWMGPGFFRDTSPGFLMNIADLLAPDAVLPGLKAQSKKQLLQELAARAHGLTRLPERRIFETLVERERLGTTGVGAGIAIPHGRMAEAKTITGIFARLENGIDYEAVDNQPVDLVFMLLAPENAGADHLKALARVSRLLRDKATCEKLRAAKSPEAIYAILTGDKNGAATAA